MGGRRLVVAALAAVVVVAGVVTPIAVALAAGPPNVTTAGYSNLRDNWDPHEPALGPSDVTSSKFGQLFATQLDGSIYSQPLVVNGTVIVTTEKAYAYGINATTGAIEWKRSFGFPFEASTIGCSDLTPDLGSTSTPVVDPTTGVVYVTTRLEKGSGGLSGAHWFLQALSAATGAEVPGFPVRIAGTPTDTPGIPFNEAYSQQRPGLLLLGGSVYIGFASDCDFNPYRGVVVGVNTTTRAETMWSDESGIGTDQNSRAGIWQSGGGLVSDGPNRIILTTGNGVSPQPAPSGHPPATLSESVLRLAVNGNGSLSPADFFAPSDAANLDAGDEDFGSGGPIALPTADFGTAAHPDLVVAVGKEGVIYLLDANDLGGFEQGPSGSNAVLEQLGPFNGVWGHPAAYGGQGGWVYVLESAGGGYLRALSYGRTAQGLPRLSSAGTSTGSFGYTSGSPLATSSGTTAGSAVVWVVYSSGSSGAGAQLRAYGAIPTKGVLPLLWSAPIGYAPKFVTPTAWNGRIFVGTRGGRLLAFGTSSGAPVQAAAVAFGSVPVGSSRTLTVSASTTRRLAVTGPVTVSGYEGVGTSSGGGAAPPTTTPSPSTTTPAGATAGPAVVPPSGNASTAGTAFRVSRPRLGSTFPAGSTIPLRVTFAPTRPGPVVATLSIPTSAGTRSVSVSGYGTAPGLLVSAQPLAFGRVRTGSGGKILALTVSNSWNHPEKLTGIGLPGAPYAVSGTPSVGTVLAPQQSVTVSVRFDPATAGTYRSRLAISTDHGSVELPVSGIAVTGFSRLSVSAATVDAGPVPVGQSATVTFDVGNSGTVALGHHPGHRPARCVLLGGPDARGHHHRPGHLPPPVGDLPADRDRHGVGALHLQQRRRPRTGHGDHHRDGHLIQPGRSPGGPLAPATRGRRSGRGTPAPRRAAAGEDWVGAGATRWARLPSGAPRAGGRAWSRARRRRAWPGWSWPTRGPARWPIAGGSGSPGTPRSEGSARCRSRCRRTPRR